MKGTKKIPAALAVIMTAALMLSGCGKGELMDTLGKNAASLREDIVVVGKDFDETRVMKPEELSSCTLNSSTEELLDDFDYLARDVHNDPEAIKGKSSEDIVSFLFVECDEYTQEYWLYDAKRGAVFNTYSPVPNCVSEYGKIHNLTDEEERVLRNQIATISVKEWKEYYDDPTASYLTITRDVSIEYSGGVLEDHAFTGYPGDTWEVTGRIKDLLYSFTYDDNPWYCVW